MGKFEPYTGFDIPTADERLKANLFGGMYDPSTGFNIRTVDEKIKANGFPLANEYFGKVPMSEWYEEVPQPKEVSAPTSVQYKKEGAAYTDERPLPADVPQPLKPHGETSVEQTPEEGEATIADYNPSITSAQARQADQEYVAEYNAKIEAENKKTEQSTPESTTPGLTAQEEAAGVQRYQNLKQARDAIKSQIPAEYRAGVDAAFDKYVVQPAKANGDVTKVNPEHVVRQMIDSVLVQDAQKWFADIRPKVQNVTTGHGAEVDKLARNRGIYSYNRVYDEYIKHYRHTGEYYTPKELGELLDKYAKEYIEDPHNALRATMANARVNLQRDEAALTKIKHEADLSLLRAAVTPNMSKEDNKRMQVLQKRVISLEERIRMDKRTIRDGELALRFQSEHGVPTWEQVWKGLSEGFVDELVSGFGFGNIEAASRVSDLNARLEAGQSISEDKMAWLQSYMAKEQTEGLKMEWAPTLYSASRMTGEIGADAPLMLISQGTGKLVASGVRSLLGAGVRRKAMNTLGREISSGVAKRYAMRTDAGNILGRMGGSAGNFIGFETYGDIKGQLSHVNPDTGQLDYNPRQTAVAAGRGFGLGLMVGAVPAIVGRAADKAVSRTSSSLAKFNIRTTQYLADLGIEAGIFEIPNIIKGDVSLKSYAESLVTVGMMRLYGAVKGAPGKIAGFSRSARSIGIVQTIDNMLTKRPQLVLTSDERDLLSRYGFGSVLGLVSREPLKEGQTRQRLDGYDRLGDVLTDKRVPLVIKAKLYQTVTGKAMAAPLVARVERAQDPGGTVTVRTFSNTSELVTEDTYRDLRAAEVRVEQANKEIEEGRKLWAEASEAAFAESNKKAREVFGEAWDSVTQVINECAEKGDYSQLGEKLAQLGCGPQEAAIAVSLAQIKDPAHTTEEIVQSYGPQDLYTIFYVKHAGEADAKSLMEARFETASRRRAAEAEVGAEAVAALGTDFYATIASLGDKANTPVMREYMRALAREHAVIDTVQSLNQAEIKFETEALRQGLRPDGSIVQVTFSDGTTAYSMGVEIYFNSNGELAADSNKPIVMRRAVNGAGDQIEWRDAELAPGERGKIAKIETLAKEGEGEQYIADTEKNMRQKAREQREAVVNAADRMAREKAEELEDGEHDILDERKARSWRESTGERPERTEAPQETELTEAPQQAEAAERPQAPVEAEAPLQTETAEKTETLEPVEAPRPQKLQLDPVSEKVLTDLRVQTAGVHIDPGVNGYYAGGRFIAVNMDRPGEVPVVFVIGHETAHIMERLAPDEYARLRDVIIRAEEDRKGYDACRDEWNRRAQDYGDAYFRNKYHALIERGIPEEEAQRQAHDYAVEQLKEHPIINEMVNDRIGDLLCDPRYADRMIAAEPGLMMRLYEAAIRALEYIRSKIGGGEGRARAAERLRINQEISRYRSL